MPKYQCKNCKKENHTTNKFCIYCGTKKRIVKRKTNEYKKILHSLEGVTVALLAKVAKSDGNISKVESTYMSTVYDMFCEGERKPSERREIFKQILSKEKNSVSNVSALCTVFTRLSPSNKRKLELVSMLVTLALKDNDYNTKEENLIVKVVNYLDVDYSDYRKIVEKFMPKEKTKHKEKQNTKEKSFGDFSLEDCYKLLESSNRTSADQLKKNYRGLAKKYHTDIMKGKDLPDDIIAFAEEKLKAINFAYEKIKNHKGF